MARHEVVIESVGSNWQQVFSSKKDAIHFFRAMLRRYRNNQKITDIDSQALRSLLERHPEAQQKIGCGVRHFLKAPTDEGTSCFWIERDDGTKTDFSYISCANARGPSLYQQFAEACRQAVKSELEAAKKKHFGEHANSDGKVRCEVTGELVTTYESHLDHKKPFTFQVIVISFITANNLTITAEMLSRPTDAQYVATLIDEDIQNRFREYHRKTANLRIIKIQNNLSLGGSERVIKPKRPVIL